tara:strand:+ start:561 stop:815 length:255 start_codon:yes stop_codon:yes gene_type:complete
MREPEKRTMEYCGFYNPRDFDEIQFELLGLEHLIKRAEERISMLKQSSFLANLVVNNKAESLDNYFNDGDIENGKSYSLETKEK